MANQALVLQINETLDDPGLELPILGGMSFDFYKKGDGTGTSSFLIGVTQTTDIQIAGGELLDSSGVSLGTLYTLPIGNTTLKLRATQDHGRVLIKNSTNIERLGSGSTGFFKPNSPANSPVVKFDVSQLPNKLLVLDSTDDSNVIFTGNMARALSRISTIAYATFKGLESRMIGDTRNGTFPTTLAGLSYSVKTDNSEVKLSIDKVKPFLQLILRSGQLYGNLSSLKNGMTEYNVAGNVKDFTTGNIATLPTSLKTIIIETASNLVYVGSRVWNDDSIYFIVTGNVVFDAQSVDQILNDAANAAWTNGGLISLKGSRTSASDGAVATLQTKAVAVQIASV